jgi:hypothetical protein
LPALHDPAICVAFVTDETIRDSGNDYFYERCLRVCLKQ